MLYCFDKSYSYGNLDDELNLSLLVKLKVLLEAGLTDSLSLIASRGCEVPVFQRL